MGDIGGRPPTSTSSSSDSVNVREQTINFTTSWHGDFKNLMVVLVAIASIKFQAKSEDPFDKYPIKIWTYIVAICFYFLTKLSIPMRYSQVVRNINLSATTLSAVSILSLLLPCVAEWLIFIPWLCLLVYQGRVLFVYIYYWLAPVFDTVKRGIGQFMRFVKCNSEGELPDEMV